MESLAEELTCPVCLDLYEQPVLLPCAHSLCKRCASTFFAEALKRPSEQPAEEWKAPKHIQCPSCRYEFPLPDLRVDGLRKNTTLQNIVDRYRESKNNTAVPCQMCDKEPPNNAVKTCLVCDNSYCETCLVAFHPMKGGLARHTLADASAATPKAPISSEHQPDMEKVGKNEDQGAAAGPDTFQQKQTKKQPDIYSTLWTLDHNHLKIGVDYDLDLYGEKLFPFVSRDNLEQIPTYRAFLNFLDNYDEDQPEYVTAKEENNARAFLNRCLDTEVMQEAHNFLWKKGCVPETRNGFKDMLYKMWFTPYTRTHSDGVKRPSTAFEHTFVGETHCQHMMGFHNWLSFYDKECLGNIQLNSYCRYDCDDRVILNIDFEWRDELRQTKDSFFVGTSPEFELALYTVCFLAGGGEKTEVVLGGQNITIATYKLNGHIGSCYPIMQGQDQTGHWNRIKQESDTESDFEEQDQSDTESETEDDSDEDPLFAEGLDFLQYLEDENIGPEMGKRKLKMIYEEEYTESCGRRSGTPFSQVLRTLKRDGKVEVSRNHHGVDIITILE
ncbi:poly(U)-specific endoribonuclease homolog [Branchiostoma floridae]|uniref:Uridylate-specific endoribonuclease n=1 Tax=Branchiostoma floridae TaxID=7739 RepID=A0A9J7L6Z7_BRAFL|nr:poly(U)-specific endoribonuclease homolog [Branchiostoma floridae]